MSFSRAEVPYDFSVEMEDMYEVRHWLSRWTLQECTEINGFGVIGTVCYFQTVFAGKPFVMTENCFSYIIKDGWLFNLYIEKEMLNKAFYRAKLFQYE